VKHITNEPARKMAGERAKNKEAAWLVARLVELLQAVWPTATPEPANRAGRKTRNQ